MSTPRIPVSLWDKPALSRAEAESLCLSQGRACLDDFVRAGWITPRAYRGAFSSADLRHCLDRILANEDPRKKTA